MVKKPLPSPLPENGFVQKAVNYDGEMHIIEEVQPFETSEAIKVLRLSLSTVSAHRRCSPHPDRKHTTHTHHTIIIGPSTSNYFWQQYRSSSLNMHTHIHKVQTLEALTV